MARTERVWERVSHDAWDYVRGSDGSESWEVVLHAVGTEGSLALYVFGRQCMDGCGGERLVPDVTPSGAYYSASHWRGL